MFHASHLTFHPFTPIIYNIVGGIAFELSNYFCFLILTTWEDPLVSIRLISGNFLVRKSSGFLIFIFVANFFFP